LAKQFAPDLVLLGGERDGEPIEGFDLGNSPDEYTPDRVEGKTVVFTTTNGTQAINHARTADEVFPGLVRQRRCHRPPAPRSPERPYYLCGTDGKISDDDVLLAGLLVERLQREGGLVYQQNGQAMTARELWLRAFALPQSLGAEILDPDRLAAVLRKSLGAQNLISLGLDDDIIAASWISRFNILPKLDAKTMRIVPEGLGE